ncbi:MAG: fumarate hydratase [Spirochaetaceae bacterium]|jgi:fumarate hydratase class I|nr:fumarate hydratase [Spirochaetaceae bacterium]
MDIAPLIGERFSKTEFAALVTVQKPVFQDGRLLVPPAALEALSEEAFRRLSFFYRRSHLALLAAACGKQGTTENERAVIRSLLDNAVIAAEGRLPLCQDTGAACVYAWKPEGVVTGVDDRALLERGAVSAYRKHRLRASILAPASFFDEYNTGGNLPAQIRIEAAPPPENAALPCYRFLFAAKGGGSSNKTAYFPSAPDILYHDSWDNFLREKIEALGTAACPPYRLALVLGGLSPEENLETLKLATTELLDDAPYFTPAGNGNAGAACTPAVFRDLFWENRAMEIAERSGLGAQLGGKRLALDVRVLRLPRHAASCPVSIGVSCAAHRNMLGFIDERGVFLEKLEENPAEFLERAFKKADSALSPEIETRRVCFDVPIAELCEKLSGFKAGEALLASGKMLVARDAAHLAWRKLLKKGEPLPPYLFRYPVFYAGPAETPAGCVAGSIGPTTSARMDGFAEELLSRGASLVTVGKGCRSAIWTDAALRYGGRYLIAAGGAAALIASRHVVSVKIIDYPELAMEAVRLLEVKDLRLFTA